MKNIFTHLSMQALKGLPLNFTNENPYIDFKYDWM